MRDKRRAKAKASREKQIRRGVVAAERRRAEGKTALRDDGRRYNGYQCDPRGGCGKIYLTVDLDRGTTPMFAPCLRTQGCDGMAVSLGYPKAPPPMSAPLLIEWYTPANSEMRRIERFDPAVADHVRRGGLMRRPTFEAEAWVAERVGPIFLRETEAHPTQLTLSLGDDNGTAQEQGDHVHHGGAETGGGPSADSGHPGQGEAVGEGQEGPQQP